MPFKEQRLWVQSKVEEDMQQERRVPLREQRQILQVSDQENDTPHPCFRFVPLVLTSSVLLAISLECLLLPSSGSFSLG